MLDGQQASSVKGNQVGMSGEQDDAVMLLKTHANKALKQVHNVQICTNRKARASRYPNFGGVTTDNAQLGDVFKAAIDEHTKSCGAVPQVYCTVLKCVPIKDLVKQFEFSDGQGKTMKLAMEQVFIKPTPVQSISKADTGELHCWTCSICTRCCCEGSFQGKTACCSHLQYCSSKANIIDFLVNENDKPDAKASHGSADA